MEMTEQIELSQYDHKLTPKEIIDVAKITHSIKKFVVLFSGGKDSLTTIHMLSKMDYADEVLYCNTGIGLEENFDFVLDMCNKYGWKLNVEVPSPGYQYEDFVKKFGFPKEYNHHMIMNYLKWRSMRAFLRKHKGDGYALVSGRRLNESARRKTVIKYTMKPIWREASMIIVAPLFFMRDDEVKRYVKDNDLPSCPVYQKLHVSGDCLCGSFFEKGDAEIISIFYPAVAKRIRELELKYGGHWGRYKSSMTGASKQSTLDKLICNDCYIDNNHQEQT
jgi:3'-phosphoadenosine 5'-phosphosulfate sulfotransferase (PAPS reductase)/FAD synthetase